MDSDGPRITVGTRWITVCNGVWHSIFLEDDGSMYPGSCNCEDERAKGKLSRKIEGLLDRERPRPGENRSRRGRAR